GGRRQEEQVAAQKPARLAVVVADLQRADQDRAGQKVEQRRRERIAEKEQGRGPEDEKADAEDALDEGADENDGQEGKHPPNYTRRLTRPEATAKAEIRRCPWAPSRATRSGRARRGRESWPLVESCPRPASGRLGRGRRLGARASGPLRIGASRER